jgi:amino acid transporter
MLAAATFIGFEATAVYTEEAKDPIKTVPRATNISVLFIMVFYAISTYCLINAFGSVAAIRMARSNPIGMYPAALDQYIGRFATDVMYVLLIISLFASTLSFHNIIARYLYSFGIDGVISKRFGAVHKKHGSPMVASLAVSTSSALLVLPFALIGRDPVLELYAWGAGIGTLALLSLLTIAAIAVCVYLWCRQALGEIWRRRTAPLLGILGLAAITMLAIIHVDALIGGSIVLAGLALSVIVLALLTGFVLALRIRRRNPDKYARIGRCD